MSTSETNNAENSRADCDPQAVVAADLVSDSGPPAAKVGGKSHCFKPGNRGGAPKGNRNAIVSGLRSVWTTGKLPANANYVARITREMRAHIEQEVLLRRGVVELPDRALAQTAATHEARALLCQRKLRLHEADLTTEQWLALVREIGNARDARDRCLKALHLQPTNGKQKFADLYASVIDRPADTTAAPDTPSDPQAAPCDDPTPEVEPNPTEAASASDEPPGALEAERVAPPDSGSAASKTQPPTFLNAAQGGQP